ncbi:TlpA disulfide reductase family protein [Aegicerativicinus sediminis]|uniref:TlpA disulfide reductase family protein n=1 Tax=Aegicerativicinus sediminis TaxID=2893202 RepID=UPI001E335090|nr:TlpA disulfide reductase family protein [Aegicerativicinus sediminis]
MKRHLKILIPTLIIFLSLFSCEKEVKQNESETPKTFTVNADIKNMTSEYLVYYEKDDSKADGYRRDTIPVTNGKFKFTDSINEPYKIYFIGIPEALRRYKVTRGDKEYDVSVKAHLMRMWFIGYPGAEISYNGKIEEFMVDAYPSDKDGINDKLGEINSQIFPLANTIDSITVASSTGNFTEEEQKAMYEQIKKLSNEILDLKTKFIEANPNSVAATYIFNDAFYRKYYDNNEAKRLFESFNSELLAGTPFYEEAKERLEAIENTAIGMKAPEVTTTNTLDGSEFKLSDLKGNYVLLDFWGTWCGPCMAEMPKIKKLHKKYKDKNFKIVGVDSGDTIERWKNSIEKNEFDWIQIRSTDENNLIIPFNVNSFPTKIIIDPNGDIVYSSKSETPSDMYTMIDEFMK